MEFSISMYKLASKLAIRCRSVFLAAIAVLISTGCTTARLNLFTSPPGAKVYGKPIGSGHEQLLGETPLAVDAGTIESEHHGSGPAILEFKKEGFKTSTVVITELAAQDLNLNLELAPEGGLDDYRRVNDIVETMFRIQRLVKAKRLDEAMSMLRDLKKEAPQVSSVYEMEGGIFYLKRQYQDALDSYRLAVRYDPRNAEATRMRDVLEKTFGIDRLPSDTGGTP